jgi:hypothetical protein
MHTGGILLIGTMLYCRLRRRVRELSSKGAEEAWPLPSEGVGYGRSEWPADECTRVRTTWQTSFPAPSATTMDAWSPPHQSPVAETAARLDHSSHASPKGVDRPEKCTTRKSRSALVRKIEIWQHSIPEDLEDVRVTGSILRQASAPQLFDHDAIGDSIAHEHPPDATVKALIRDASFISDGVLTRSDFGVVAEGRLGRTALSNHALAEVVDVKGVAQNAHDAVAAAVRRLRGDLKGAADDGQELRIEFVIGRGGFGTVYKGASARLPQSSCTCYRRICVHRAHVIEGSVMSHIESRSLSIITDRYTANELNHHLLSCIPLCVFELSNC